jgi:Bacterial Ig-like domain (group 2)/Secretion system C-terminal sorting domain
MPPTVADISGSSSVCPGSTIQLSDATPNGTWSTSNLSVATVNNSGRVRGIRNGRVTITYSVSNGCGTQTADIDIAVTCSFRKNSLGAATNSQDQLTLDVSVSPNPSQNFFTLITQSSVLNAPVNIMIFDMSNRLVDRHTAGVGEAVRFGDGFASGMYIIQVTQGAVQKVVKVVKN